MSEEEEILEKKGTTGKITVQNTNVKTYQVSTEVIENIKESVIHELRTNQEFRRSIVCEALGTTDEALSVRQDDEIELQEVNTKTAEKMIQEFIQSNPGCKTSDLIINLQLPPQQVVEILKKLKEADVVQSKDVGQRTN